MDERQRYEQGTKVRREVLGDAHVDKSLEMRNALNKEFQDLTPQIDREVDPKKRLELIRKTEEIMEKDPPLLPISWEKILDIWFNYVKGHNPYEYFGLYDVVRLDTIWLDKA